MYDENIQGTIGSPSQIKEVTSRLLHISKNLGVIIIIVGHVTKDGIVAGPRMLEHMVDVVMYIEGERYESLRIVKSVKNRFGSTGEIGLFNMKENGLEEIKNINEIFVNENEKTLPGSSVTIIEEGNTNIFIEVQALTTHSYSNIPRRVANGIDFNRFSMLLAVLEKKCNLALSAQDIFVNIVGGLRINNPSVDLSLCASIISTYKNRVIEKDTILIGEVSLTGQIKECKDLEKKIKECEKMGYKNIITKTKIKSTSINIINIETVEELFNIVVKNK